MNHVDLFSGIGGFALAARNVWGGAYRNVCFCEINKYCQAVLRKNFGKDIVIYDDIRDLTSYTSSDRWKRKGSDGETQKGLQKRSEPSRKLSEGLEGRDCIDLLTGGFPCQPFSQAGQRRGTEDDRFLWPEMLRVISEFRPTWIIGENVAGLLSMAEFDGKSEVDSQTDLFGNSIDVHTKRGRGVLYRIIGELEQIGYSVQTFVIPACAVGAPHRRDRVWIVAHSTSQQNDGERRDCKRGRDGMGRQEQTAQRHNRQTNNNGISGQGGDAPDTKIKRRKRPGNTRNGRTRLSNSSWNQNWPEVATRFCGVDDGLPDRLHKLREVICECSDDQKTESTLTASAWVEMRKVWEFWKAESASQDNESEGFYYFMCELPYPRTQEDWEWDLGTQEKAKELCRLWEVFYASSFKEAQNLFGELSERIRSIERSKTMVQKNGATLSKAGHRVERLKALGNAIVPQVAEQIMQAIKEVEQC